jgi:hypothetical protein
MRDLLFTTEYSRKENGPGTTEGASERTRRIKTRWSEAFRAPIQVPWNANFEENIGTAEQFFTLK